MDKDTATPSLPFRIGVDVGGTKIASSLVDADGRVRHTYRCPTDTESVQATLASIVHAIRETMAGGGVDQNDISGIGLGIPGLVDPEAGIGIASVNLNWKNVPVKAELEKEFNIPCFIENDVRAAALGEACYGSGKGARNLVLINIGTGIAAAVLLNGQVYRGASGFAGEIGHASVDFNGPVCKCGGRGCFEAVAAGPAVARQAQEMIRSGRKSVLTEWSGGDLAQIKAEDVFKAAESGDSVALDTIRKVCFYIAIATQYVFLAYDPDVVIFAGGVTEPKTLFLNTLLEETNRLAAASWVFAATYHPDKIRLSELGKDLAVVGAAALVSNSPKDS